MTSPRPTSADPAPSSPALRDQQQLHQQPPSHSPSILPQSIHHLPTTAPAIPTTTTAALSDSVPFTAPLPIITTPTTTHHPQTYYIFTDDESPLPTFLSSQTPLTYRPILVDLAPAPENPTGWSIASATSLTPTWSVTSAALLPLSSPPSSTSILVAPGTSPSSAAGISPASAGTAVNTNATTGTVATGPNANATKAEDSGYTVLQITGASASAVPSSKVLRVPSRPESHGHHQEGEVGGKDYAGLIADFDERMANIWMLAEAGKWSLDKYRFEDWEAEAEAEAEGEKGAETKEAVRDTAN